jgi:hypothetical protein
MKQSQRLRGSDLEEEQAVRSVIQIYFDSMSESSREKVCKAFHPSGKVTGYLEDGLHEMTRDEFADLVASLQPSPHENDQKLHAEVLSIDITGDTAIAKVRDEYLGIMFIDTLSFIKVDDAWSIYTKLFHVEKNLAAS